MSQVVGTKVPFSTANVSKCMCPKCPVQAKSARDVPLKAGDADPHIRRIPEILEQGRCDSNSTAYDDDSRARRKRVGHDKYPLPQ